jgi:hypothetical protein
VLNGSWSSPAVHLTLNIRIRFERLAESTSRVSSVSTDGVGDLGLIISTEVINDDFDSGVPAGIVPLIFVYFSAGEATWVRSDVVRDAQDLWLREGDDREGTTGTAKDTWGGRVGILRSGFVEQSDVVDEAEVDEFPTELKHKGVPFAGVGSATVGAAEVKTGGWIVGAECPGIGRR